MVTYAIIITEQKYFISIYDNPILRMTRAKLNKNWNLAIFHNNYRYFFVYKAMSPRAQFDGNIENKIKNCDVGISERRHNFPNFPK